MAFEASVRPSLLVAGRTLLGQVTQHLVAYGLTLPDRVGVAVGDIIAWDAEELIVHCTGLSRGAPEAPETPATLAAIYPGTIALFYDFSVTLIRRIAVVTGHGGRSGGIPSADRVGVDYDAQAADMEALAAALIDIQAGFTVVGPGIPFRWGPIATTGPSGGLSGVSVPVSWQAGFGTTGDY